MIDYWILTGDVRNWEEGISNSIWGAKENLKNLWDKLGEGDILFFYVKSPISGIIGVGKVLNKFEGKNQIWVNEIRENRIIYPYRFEFQIIYVLQKPWKERKVDISNLKLMIRKGLNHAINADSINQLLETVKTMWNIDLKKPETKSEPIKNRTEISLHEDTKNKIKEIGSMKNFISETEYQIGETDRRFLDVVWRPIGVGGAAPKYIFEVEDQGGYYRSLSKLKHCFDLWGFPKLFIIVKQDEISKVNKLLEGTFHEIKEHLQILSFEKINEMYGAEKGSYEAKKNTGLP